MVDEKDENDVIAKAHLAAERLEQANAKKEELVKRMEIIEARLEGRRLLGGESNVAEPPKPELTEQQKIDLGMKQFFKGTAIEGALK